nr:putative reverse transcriptase domain-containing protein [Tanacetum cinerariifolium]
VCMPKNRQERRSRNRKSLQQSSIPNSLATWGKDDGVTMLVKSMLDGSGSVPLSQGGGDFLEEGTTGNTNIRQCLRKVADAHFTAAMKVLSSSGVAPYCDDTIKALEANHPYKPPISMSSNTFYEPLLVAYIDSVVGRIKSFPKGTLCGRDGLRAQHILDVICGEGSATAKNLLKTITLVVNLWLAGRCPPMLVEFVASAPLTPLLKQVCMPKNRQERRFRNRKSLQQSSIPNSLATWGKDDGITMLVKSMLDGSGSVPLRQGGAMKVLSSFGVAPYCDDTIKALEANHPYKPPISMSSNTFSEPLLVADIEVSLVALNRFLKAINLVVNLWLAGRCPPMLVEFVASAPLTPLLKKDNEDVFGCEASWGAISRDADFIKEMALRRATNSIENIVVCGGPFFENLQCRLASLPIRFGGLGLYSTKVASSYAFVASRAQSWVLQHHILRNSDICEMDDDYVSALACLRDTILSFDFSCFTNKDPPLFKPNRHWILLFFVDAICPVCRKACLDSFGEYAVHYKELTCFKYRHDMVMNVLYDICRRVGSPSRKKHL